MPDNSDCSPRAAKPLLVLGLLSLAVVLFVGFMALGVWQTQRLQWKLGLIDRVQRHVHATPVAAPDPAEWSHYAGESNEYSRVQVVGRFDHRRATLVRASTELGRGFWVMTPLQTTAGFWVLVNRGFVLDADSVRALHTDNADQQVINGLLRLSEPGGSLLQHNDAAAGRWYSRDVQAITANVKLNASGDPDASASVAPYFIDAAASADPAGWPRGGLTVLNFSNNHAVYAITWFVLAAMAAVAGAYLLYSERQLRAISTSSNRAGAHA